MKTTFHISNTPPKILLLFILVVLIYNAHAQNPISKYDLKRLSKLSYIELDTLYESFKIKEEYENLILCAQAALQKTEKEYGKQDTSTAKWLYNLGWAYDYGMVDSEKGLNYYNQALSIQKTTVPKSLAYANTIFAIADIYNYNFGAFTEAESMYLEAMEIRKQKLGKMHTSYVTCLNKLV